jgi:glutaredoxin 3
VKKIVMYATRYCPYCVMARRLLESKELPYEEIDVSGQPMLRQEMARKAGRTTVPQIFIDDQPIGGCDDLYALERSGRLSALLQD